MSQNLTNVYAYLRKTYPNVDMMFAKPVSYIKSLVEADTKVIFVYKEVTLKKRSVSMALFYYSLSCFAGSQQY